MDASPAFAEVEDDTVPATVSVLCSLSELFLMTLAWNRIRQSHKDIFMDSHYVGQLKWQYK